MPTPDLHPEAIRLINLMIGLTPHHQGGVGEPTQVDARVLAATAERFLAVNDWRAAPHLAIALARLVDAPLETQVLDKLAVDLAGSPLLVDELRAAACLDLPASIAVAAVVHAETRKEAADAPHHPLSAYPNYAAFAETGLKEAAERVRKIHDFELPYASDKAFTLDESDVIDRLMRVGLDRDESWVPEVLDELFRKVSLAPNAAKTLPSQSVAITLGHAIEAFPTPEALMILRGVIRDIRHAGVKKKLQRNLRRAERGLAGRPEIALRLPLDRPLSKPQLTTLTRCLEAGLALGMVLTYEDWHARLAQRAETKALTASLVWRLIETAGGSIAVLPRIDRGGVKFEDLTEAIVTPTSDCRVMLWHPSDASAAERDAWRDRLAALRIKQPFKQVFREHYIVPNDELPDTTTAMFSHHRVSIVPFLGLARREGWSIDYECLTRRFGQWTARLELTDAIYPGAVGWTIVKHLSLSKSEGKKSLPVRLGDLPVAMLSEILRAVDLLVSTSGFAVTCEDEDQNSRNRLRDLSQYSLGAMAEMRKQALERAFRGLDGMDGLQFDARHLRLGRYAIHLATGRVTCDGEPVVIDVPTLSNLAVVPWLPHQEKLLETIFYAAVEIVRRVNNN